jgi:hypothetical protein
MKGERKDHRGEKSAPPTPARGDLEERHRRLGWWTLTVFVGLGLVLEALHGFKVGWYLAVGNETRRLLWTLAHAHGTLLGLVHLALATTAAASGEAAARLKTASRALSGATLLLPTGFFFAGFGIVDGDPGPAIVLAIPGGLLLFVAALSCALALGFRRAPYRP